MPVVSDPWRALLTCSRSAPSYHVCCASFGGAHASSLVVTIPGCDCRYSSRPGSLVPGLDQVWHSSSLVCSSVRSLYRSDEHRLELVHRGMPCAANPSDHIPVGAVFTWCAQRTPSDHLAATDAAAGAHAHHDAGALAGAPAGATVAGTPSAAGGVRVELAVDGTPSAAAGVRVELAVDGTPSAAAGVGVALPDLRVPPPEPKGRTPPLHRRAASRVAAHKVCVAISSTLPPWVNSIPPDLLHGRCTPMGENRPCRHAAELKGTTPPESTNLDNDGRSCSWSGRPGGGGLAR